MVAVPPWVRNRQPARPEARLVSVVVAIQPEGSDADDGQALAVSVDPTTRKWIVYDAPAVAANGVVASTVVDPATFFWITRFTPSRYALYQSLPSVQRSTPPRLLFVNELSDPVAITSESVADGPRTAL